MAYIVITKRIFCINKHKVRTSSSTASLLPAVPYERRRDEKMRWWRQTTTATTNFESFFFLFFIIIVVRSSSSFFFIYMFRSCTECMLWRSNTSVPISGCPNRSSNRHFKEIPSTWFTCLLFIRFVIHEYLQKMQISERMLGIPSTTRHTWICPEAFLHCMPVICL